MDIEYLLFLQHFREGFGSFLAPFMLWVSDFAIGFFPVGMLCLFYWVVDRKAGKRVLFGFHLGILLNGLLKLIFCVYRPWIRDARIIPYGNAIVTATGYSFPSGHSTWATITFGSLGLWMKGKGWRVPAVLAFLFVFTVLFSRNYLGVHTPQDVVVGFLSSLFAIYAAGKMEDWTDQDSRRDWIVMAIGLLFCLGLGIFYECKSYPMDYLANGKLLVDPVRMRADSYQGLGCVAGYVIARCFERRGFDFEAGLGRKARFLIGLVAFIPLYVWFMSGVPFLKVVGGRFFAEFFSFFVFSFYVMNFIPWIMKGISTFLKKNK